jgi:hypothetical protein
MKNAWLPLDRFPFLVIFVAKGMKRDGIPDITKC